MHKLDWRWLPWYFFWIYFSISFLQLLCVMISNWLTVLKHKMPNQILNKNSCIGLVNVMHLCTPDFRRIAAADQTVLSVMLSVTVMCGDQECWGWSVFRVNNTWGDELSCLVTMMPQPAATIRRSHSSTKQDWGLCFEAKSSLNKWKKSRKYGRGQKKSHNFPKQC